MKKSKKKDLKLSAKKKTDEQTKKTFAQHSLTHTQHTFKQYRTFVGNITSTKSYNNSTRFILSWVFSFLVGFQKKNRKSIVANHIVAGAGITTRNKRKLD